MSTVNDPIVVTRGEWEELHALRGSLAERDRRIAGAIRAFEGIATRWTDLPYADADGRISAAQAEAYEDCASMARAALEAVKGPDRE